MTFRNIRKKYYDFYIYIHQKTVKKDNKINKIYILFNFIYLNK
jgi:hypothetical protein